MSPNCAEEYGLKRKTGGFLCLLQLSKYNIIVVALKKSFPGSSAGKESACNTGDSSLIPGPERASGEGIGYPLQYSWASLLVQMVKNPPSILETWVLSLGGEDPLKEGLTVHSSILAWRIPIDRGACQVI